MIEVKQEIFLALNRETLTLKVGTCRHCVAEEEGRPERAEPALDDQELDFDREGLIGSLSAYGLDLEIEQEYVCP